MLYKCGLHTFYGQALIPDVAELDREMLPYTKQCFEDLFLQGEIREILPSPIWYEERTSFGTEVLGARREHRDSKGFEVISGNGRCSGQILGGCIETL